ncbi:MAG: transposase [Alphaproteobacteria bacterium]|nr:transposase [Alphaproteobacteria bacterium]
MSTAVTEVSAYSQADTCEAGRSPRRRWPEALKDKIVAESLAAGSSVSTVARRYDVNANQVFKWIRTRRAAASADATRIVPVAVTPEPAIGGSIEVELRGGRVSIRGAVDARMVRLVLDHLR